MRTENPSDASRVRHPFAPVYDSASRVLVLGTMPSPRSRTAGFYYMHGQNRFWPVIASLAGKEFLYPNDGGSKAVDERRALVLRHGIALWEGSRRHEHKNPRAERFFKDPCIVAYRAYILYGAGGIYILHKALRKNDAHTRGMPSVDEQREPRPLAARRIDCGVSSFIYLIENT